MTRTVDVLVGDSAATMLGVEVTEPEEYTYTEIVDAIRVHGADAKADIEELWRRIAFTILITNVDDHLCNHGFLHKNREFWRLSPASTSTRRPSACANRRRGYPRMRVPT